MVEPDQFKLRKSGLSVRALCLIGWGSACISRNLKKCSREQRLLIGDRVPDPEFHEVELLYIAVMRQVKVGDTWEIPYDDIDYPSVDGTSVNRGRYSVPTDLPYTARKEKWGVGKITVEAVLAIPEDPYDLNDREYKLVPTHLPVPAKNDTHGNPIPENYSHTILRTFIDSEPRKRGKKLGNTIKTRIRTELRNAIRWIRGMEAPKDHES